MGTFLFVPEGGTGKPREALAALEMPLGYEFFPCLASTYPEFLPQLPLPVLQRFMNTGWFTAWIQTGVFWGEEKREPLHAVNGKNKPGAWARRLVGNLFLRGSQNPLAGEKTQKVLAPLPMVT